MTRRLLYCSNITNLLMITSDTPAKLSRNEELKVSSPVLAGTIAQSLVDDTTERFSDEDYEFLKFHGVYQQDDRDKRKIAKQYIFMVRGRLPGGVVHPDLYLAFDALAGRHGNNTLRITSRQGFQFHGVVKSGLAQLIKGINASLGTTLAACGDVNRNVMAPPTPATSPLVEQVQEQAREVSNALLPSTRAYHQIWVEGTQIKVDEPANQNFVDPLYGKAYLPRKFKTAFAIPPLNDIDVFTNCLGFIAIAEGEKLTGYNLIAGGGMGMSHGNAQTFPRIADVIGFLTPDKVVTASKAVLTIHRDFGDRANRKHARLKYILEDRGVDWFREEFERRAGFKLEPARAFEFTRQGDLFGWHRQTSGNYFLGLHVETGRIKDTETVRLKSALREIVQRFKPEVRLTASQNLLLVNVPDDQRDPITRLLAEHGVDVESQSSQIRRASMACPALPTCGLALAESERQIPGLLTQIEDLLGELRLADEEIVIRMTGCPNGCARPYMAELGFVGKAPNKYHIFVGGNEAGTRMARVFKENVKGDQIIEELRPTLRQFAQERQPSERFGDFCARVLWTEPAAPAA